MGCNSSKLDNEGEVVPARIRPLLRRRFEEIKRRRIHENTLKETLSKKQLLKDGVEEDDHSRSPSVDQDINESKSISSSEGSVRSAKVAPEPVSNNKEFVEIMNQEESTKQDNKDEDEEKKENVVELEALVALEQVMVVENVEEEDEEEDEEDERRISNAFICPGSPSFRVYCIQPLTIDNDDSKDDNTHKKSPSGDSVEIPESVNSSEDSETKKKKKARIASKFRRVIPKGRPGAVRNLLNVKSCYYPACSGHDNHRLLSIKTHA